MPMSRHMKEFISAVNYKIAAALKAKVPILHIIAALEAISAELETHIEKKIPEAKIDDKGKPSD